ncbi:MAG TPA: TolC family protein [Candidatus Binatia bacterium]|nr:TolC family protein [Candidatus Binatia bacterium]
MMFSLQLKLFLSVVTLATLLPALSPAADSPAPAQPPAAQTAAPPAKNVLTLDEAIQIALENHPNIKASRERIGAQEAVVGQQMAAYYPTVNMNNFYRTGTQVGGGPAGTSTGAFDTYLSQTNVAMTLYNFGKREGNVQSARDTLDATNFNYKTTADGIVLGVKQAYFTYLGLRALVNVGEETVKSRQLLARQAQGFYEVGTRARIDVARAESNLFLSEANLITAQNAVKVAWAVLKNAMGVRDLPERPLVEDVTMTPIPYTLDQAKEIAFASRPELKSFDAQRKAQDQLIAVARRGHLPDLIFDADYRKSGTSASERTFPLQGAWQVQLSLLIPIFDGFRTTNRVQETLHNYYVVSSQEELQRQQVALDVEQAYLRLVELQERIKANEAALNAAKENLDLANGRYQVGVGSIIEATDAQTLYTEAQTTYIRTLYDYKIAEAQFIRAIGQ